MLNEPSDRSGESGAGPTPPPLPPRKPVPAIPITEPGVLTPPPFASVYTPPAQAGYYPPAYPGAIDYPSASLATPNRPSVITALGVMSIIVASLSLIASFFSGCVGTFASQSADHAKAFAQTGANGQTLQLLAVRQVDAVVNTADSYTNNHLTARHKATMRQELLSPAYTRWLTNASNVAGVTSQVKSATVSPDGIATISFQMGTMQIDSAGRLIGKVSPATAPTAPPIATFTINRNSCGFLIAEAVFSVVLAGALMTAGILCLRQNPLSRLIFLGYGVMKLLCGAGAIWAAATMIQSVDSNADVFAYVQAGIIRGTGRTVIAFSALGLVFPLVVLGMLLGNSAVKEYYRSAR